MDNNKKNNKLTSTSEKYNKKGGKMQRAGNGAGGLSWRQENKSPFGGRVRRATG